MGETSMGGVQHGASCWCLTGNKVTESPDDSAKLVVTAMKNVVSALKTFNLQDSIKVSTALSFGVLSNSFPPSDGAFNSNLAFVLDPLLEFLNENRSPFMVNIYPYFTVKDDSSLKFALFEPSDRAFVDRNGFRYDNMFDAQLDAVHFAILNQFRRTRKVSDAQLDAVHFSLADQNYNDMKTVVTESGYRTRGPPRDKYSTIDNAMTYNKNLIHHVTSVSRTTAMPGEVHVMSGTPARPNVEVDVYIFSLFNENQKDESEIEGYWGIFNPDMTPKALDWVCGPGKADCSAIQPGGGQCFEPNDLVSHASFAFNNYYQKNGLSDEACSFGGTGIKVYSDPSHGNCIYNVKSNDQNGRTWCVASRQASQTNLQTALDWGQASQTNLQTALDWACGPGKADCSSIQPNLQCFEPNTLLSHASFAFNNYYQKNRATDVSCSFHGNAIKVDKDPSYGNCIYHCNSCGSHAGLGKLKVVTCFINAILLMHTRKYLDMYTV
ncbi:hypothetical protein F3Y22_tig00110201pilonHSYRG00309 [Hibiscus syriacus]|uniref:glucan endo-1,3-beta-D-glucosidase n=1 Tax=Hibiscus syriacus TaxID=106335 RepID=A0A6A3BFD5_HIBSY|nr:hypothetical protein F3Y22_tig00110201pilonHSYRG00309 [Hibiscus syriacus]